MVDGREGLPQSNGVAKDASTRERQMVVLADMDFSSKVRLSIGEASSIGPDEGELYLRPPVAPESPDNSHVITDRTWKQVEGMMPDLKARVMKERGKIVFIGNGLSTIPLIAAERYGSERTGELPIIVDLFDYNLLLADLIKVKEAFVTAQIPLARGTEIYLEKLEQLCEKINKGTLEATIYRFGSGSIPPGIRDAALAISCVGPLWTPQVIEEQRQILRVGGELYVAPATYHRSGDFYEVARLDRDSEKITRLPQLD